MSPKLLEDLPPVLSVPEVAELLRISRNSCYELIRKDLLPSLKLGRRIVVPRAALERLLDGAVISAADETPHGSPGNRGPLQERPRAVETATLTRTPSR